MWHWQVINTSWLYSFLSSWIFFSHVPQGSLEEALNCFLRAEDVSKNGMSLVRLMIAKTYLAKGDKLNASKWLRNVLIMKVKTEEDQKIFNEAKLLIQELKE
jgi:hypothetical protein